MNESNRKSLWARNIVGLILSLVLALTSFMVADWFKGEDASKYVLGIVTFLVSLFLAHYYDLQIKTIPEIHAKLDQQITEIRRRMTLVDTLDQVAKQSPEVAERLSESLLPAIKDLLTRDARAYAWPLERQLVRFAEEVEVSRAKGFSTDHSYIEALMYYTDKTNEVLMTSVLPPSLWRRPEIGRDYFNMQARLAREGKLRVKRIFLVKSAKEYPKHSFEEIKTLHVKAGLEIKFVEVHEAKSFQDFVIFRDVAVICAPALSKNVWDGLMAARSPEEVWEHAKEGKGLIFSPSHSEARHTREIFDQLKERDPIPEALFTLQEEEGGGEASQS